MHQAYLDELLSWASHESLKEDLLRAKAEFFAATGEVHEEDKAFEPRMALMLDYFVFDRPLPATGRTPAETFVLEQAPKRAVEDAERMRGFAHTVHSLFEVKKLLKDGVRLRDLLSGGDRDILERRKLAGLSKGDLLDARLIPFDGRFVFSPAFCFHPSAAKPNIVQEIKRRKKESPGSLGRDLLWALCRMALKVDRYRNVALENIYRFDGAGL